MSSRHFLAVLIHRCSVERETATQSESGEMAGTYSVVSTNVPCRLVRRVQRYPSERMSEETLKTDIVLVKADLDVRVGDRLTSWTWASDGSAYAAGDYTVLNRLQRNIKTAHHASLEVEQIG